MPFDAFICYKRSSGKDFADHLTKGLEELGLNVFLDSKDIPGKVIGTEEWRNIRDKAVMESKTFILLITPGVELSPESLREFELARKSGSKEFVYFRHRDLPRRRLFNLESEVVDLGKQQQISFETKEELLRLANKLLVKDQKHQDSKSQAPWKVIEEKPSSALIDTNSDKSNVQKLAPPDLVEASEYFPGSKELLEGSMPSASLILIGPSGIGKTVFCKQFLFNGLIIGDPCVYVTSDESPEEIIESAKKFGFDIEPYLNNGKFRIVDCYSWKIGSKSTSKYTVENPANLEIFSKVLDDALKGLKNIRLVFDSITGFAPVYNTNVNTFPKFLQSLVARLKKIGGKAIFAVAPETFDPKFVSFLREAFDGTLEMKKDELGRKEKRLLRVFSLRDAKHKTFWVPFEKTENKIIVKNEIEHRCAMCSKIIKKPYIQLIKGNKYSFDSPECARTYKKFKHLYGKHFD
jgi:KaiC/GvpD/RAD55 family RecA-like ATPase